MTSLPVPTERQIEAQQRWEIQNIQAGIERYRRLLEVAPFDTTIPGRKLITEVLGDPDQGFGAVWAIRKMQQDIAEKISSNTGRRTIEAEVVLLMMKPEVLAYVGLKCVLNSNYLALRNSQSWVPLTQVEALIGDTIKAQMELEVWMENQKKVSKAAGKKSLVQITKENFPHLSRKKWAEMRRRWYSVPQMTWTTRLKVELGAMLVKALVEDGGGWFAIEKMTGMVSKTHKGRSTILVLGISEEAREYLSDLNNRLEVTRPYLLPMICPPRPWIHVEPE